MEHGGMRMDIAKGQVLQTFAANRLAYYESKGRIEFFSILAK